MSFKFNPFTAKLDITGNQVTALVAPSYQATYYKTTQQNLVNGSTDITFDANASWNNSNGYITHTSGSSDFVVSQAGLYQLDFNASINANGATWNVANNKVVSIDITRSPIAEQVTIAQTAVTASTQNYIQSVSSNFYLEIGDVINLRVQGNYATAIPFVQPLANTFDLNTWFSWKYVSATPISLTAIRGQVSKMTSGTITIATAGTYQSTGLTATLDTTTAVGMTLGTTDLFAVKNTSGATRVLKIYSSMDASSANNETLGIRMAKNGTSIPETECRNLTGSHNFAKLVTNWMITMAPNDEVALFVANHSSTHPISLQRGRVTASFVD